MVCSRNIFFFTFHPPQICYEKFKYNDQTVHLSDVGSTIAGQ